MANSDQAQYTLRYNEITGDLEAQVGLNWVTIALANAGGITQLTGDVTAGPGSGSQAATVTNTAAVKSIHADAQANLTGAVQLVSGTNVTLTQVGQAITIASSGGGGGSPNVVHTVDTADHATSSSIPVTTGVSVTITASSNTAAIQVITSGCLRAENASASGCNLFLYKDGSPTTARNSLIENSGGGDTRLGFSCIWLDVPGDTSPHTYTLFIANDDSSTPVHLYGPGATTVIVASEIH